MLLYLYLYLSPSSPSPTYIYTHTTFMQFVHAHTHLVFAPYPQRLLSLRTWAPLQTLSVFLAGGDRKKEARTHRHTLDRDTWLWKSWFTLRPLPSPYCYYTTRPINVHTGWDLSCHLSVILIHSTGSISHNALTYIQFINHDSLSMYVVHTVTLWSIIFYYWAHYWSYFTANEKKALFIKSLWLSHKRISFSTFLFIVSSSTHEQKLFRMWCVAKSTYIKI